MNKPSGASKNAPAPRAKTAPGVTHPRNGMIRPKVAFFLVLFPQLFAFSIKFISTRTDPPKDGPKKRPAVKFIPERAELQIFNTPRDFNQQTTQKSGEGVVSGVPAAPSAQYCERLN
jgi:hypothetical protein